MFDAIAYSLLAVIFNLHFRYLSTKPVDSWGYLAYILLTGFVSVSLGVVALVSIGRAVVMVLK